MTDLPSLVQGILESQETEVSIHPSGQCAQARILGIAETRDKIMEAVGGGWNEAIEQAAKLLDESAQDFNKIRDPGMANHDRAAAKRTRSLRRPDVEPAGPNMERIAAALAALVDAHDFSYLDRGIGTATDEGKRWLEARAVSMALIERKER